MTTNKKCYKLSDDDKKEILLAYKLDNSKENLQKISKQYNITRQTIWNISKDKKSVDSIKDYKQSFTKKANLIIDALLDKIYKQALNADDKTQIAQLTTSLGIIYDKLRLNDNESTSNNSIKIDIKIE